jgi:FkbM family methyltransferase
MGLRVLGSKGDGLQTIIGALFASGKRGHFIDIGANVGQTLLTLRSICDLNYIGFEPDITAAYYVSELIRLNGFQNAEVLSIALGSQNSSGLFRSNGPADESATLGLDLRPQRMYANTTRVAVCKGDDLIMALPAPHIFMIKIDVEGLEREVLNGLANTIEHCRPPVYFEVMGYRHLLDGTYPRSYFGGELPPDQISCLVENRRSNMQRLREFWVEREYLLFRCMDDGTIRPSTTLDEPDSPGEMNFLAVSKEDISSVTEATGASMVRV